MTPLRSLVSRLGALRHRRRRDAELDEEIETHLSLHRGRAGATRRAAHRCDGQGESRVRWGRARQGDLSRSAGTALPRNIRAGRALRAPRPSQEPCVRCDRHRHAGARHRREHRYLQPHRCADAARASRRASARAHQIEDASDREAPTTTSRMPRSGSSAKGAPTSSTSSLQTQRAASEPRSTANLRW